MHHKITIVTYSGITYTAYVRVANIDKLGPSGSISDNKSSMTTTGIESNDDKYDDAAFVITLTDKDQARQKEQSILQGMSHGRANASRKPSRQPRRT